MLCATVFHSTLIYMLFIKRSIHQHTYSVLHGRQRNDRMHIIAPLIDPHPEVTTRCPFIIATTIDPATKFSRKLAENFQQIFTTRLQRPVFTDNHGKPYGQASSTRRLTGPMQHVGQCLPPQILSRAPDGCCLWKSNVFIQVTIPTACSTATFFGSVTQSAGE